MSLLQPSQRCQLARGRSGLVHPREAPPIAPPLTPCLVCFCLFQPGWGIQRVSLLLSSQHRCCSVPRPPRRGGRAGRGELGWRIWKVNSRVSLTRWLLAFFAGSFFGSERAFPALAHTTHTHTHPCSSSPGLGMHSAHTRVSGTVYGGEGKRGACKARCSFFRLRGPPWGSHGGRRDSPWFQLLSLTQATQLEERGIYLFKATGTGGRVGTEKIKRVVRKRWVQDCKNGPRVLGGT